MKKQYFPYRCPICRCEENATEVAAKLPDEVVIAESARRIGRKQSPHAGPGRPTIVSCPGCDQEMATVELREHRLPCLHARLKTLLYRNVRLHPKDPDPYPDFRISEVRDTEVQFDKLSSNQYIIVELQKIAEIVVDSQQDLIFIRVLGRVAWDDATKRWRFVPSRIGRPATVRT